MKAPDRVRTPAVAGTFYPSDPKRLEKEIFALLAGVATVQADGRPLVLIEPHAGYIYSGQVAAYGYRLIEKWNIRTVIILSPSHMEYFPFVSVFNGDAYETPLGRIPVDKEFVRRIATTDPLVKASEKGHIQDHLSRQEHALEVQLPFLQCVLREFRIVPIVMGNQDWKACSAVGNILGPYLLDHGVLVVASSDLSHFHPYEDAKRMDGAFCELLQEMDPERLYDAVKKNTCEACGAGPVVASLVAARQAGATSCHVLSSANSGDVTGDRANVVGYVAAVITAGKGHARKVLEHEESRGLALSSGERSHLLSLARAAVENAVAEGGSLPTPLPESSNLHEKRGAFVTLEVRKRLRGCIGFIEPVRSLYTLIPEIAEAAALRDPRFTPLSPQELPLLDIKISVLSPLRRIAHPEEIEIGRHGLVVERGPARGVLLPQVAESHGWDVLEFLAQTCEKAGIERDSWQKPDTTVYVFTTLVFGEERELTARDRWSDF